MPLNSPSREDQAAVLAEAQRSREFLTLVSWRWSRRPGIKLATDAARDELAMVVTGNRDALLDPLHKTP